MVYEDILVKAKRDLLKIPGVTGVGLTHSTISETTPHLTYQIVVYIKDVSVTKSLPSVIDGLPVVYKISKKIEIHAFTYTPDAFEAAKQKLKPKSLQSLTQYVNKYRPLLGGVSGGIIGSKVNSTGTLGCFVLDSTGKIVILSNNHVLAWDIAGSQYKGITGESITQPGLVDGGSLTNDKVGTLEKSVTITSTGNKIDAAYATTTATDLRDPNICNLLTNEITTPVVGMTVRKAGRTTGCVTGTIESTNLSADITYDIHTINGTVTFTVSYDDLISISNASYPVSQAGDSGSMWVTNDTNYNAIALNFAGDDTGMSVSCKASTIESLLGVKFGVKSVITPTTCTMPSTVLSML